MTDLARRVRGLLMEDTLALPLPGGGATADRLRSLMEFARLDMSLGRIIEAHTDAVAILAESGRQAARKLYGVWASDGPHSRLTATPLTGGGWRLEGLKQYCGGASLADAALVTAHAEHGLLLLDVPMDTPGITILPSTWVTAALSDTATGPVSFAAVDLPNEAAVGEPNWYLQRPGFWHGVLGPAACWAGGARFLIDAAAKSNKKDPHSRAHVGALQSIAWGLDALLAQAALEIDADPNDRRQQARVRALKVRHLIERWCTQVMDHFGRATGPLLLAHDAETVRHYSALTLYLRQCHAERDLETIPAGYDVTSAPPT
jgi:alkylation response protein AidB-like acyl-CoA dehydrogenase